MKSFQKVPNTIFEIDFGYQVPAKWTSYLKEIEPLGSGNFGIVYLAEDLSDGKKYVVKEVMTKNKNEKIQKLLLNEPD